MLRSIADDIRDALPSLTSSGIDADTKGAIEGWLAADKDFNAWFLETTKGALADDELMDLLGGYGESQETISKAWSAFRDDANASSLRAGIDASISRMKKLMSR